MLSIIIPLYNKELSVKSTIQSVLDQTYQEFEIVVVNDGSTDNSIKVVEQFKDSRIRLIHQENRGVSAARNKGIKKAKFEWICFLDADDLWFEYHLETLKRMIAYYPKELVFTTSFVRSNETTNKNQDESINIIDNYFKAALKSYVTWTSVICINKKVFNKVGYFNVNLNRGEDLDLWARIGKKYRYVKSNLITAIYRIETGNNLTTGLSEYNKSILSIIDLKGLKFEERKYFKRMIIERFKQNIRVLDLKGILKLIIRHNKELLF